MPHAHSRPSRSTMNLGAIAPREPGWSKLGAAIVRMARAAAAMHAAESAKRGVPGGQRLEVRA